MGCRLWGRSESDVTEATQQLAAAADEYIEAQERNHFLSAPQQACGRQDRGGSPAHSKAACSPLALLSLLDL